MFQDQVMDLVASVDSAVQTLDRLLNNVDEGRLLRAEAVHFDRLDLSEFVSEGWCPSTSGEERGYRVRLDLEDSTWNCTCKDRALRGPEVGACKHTIALAIVVRQRAETIRDALVKAIPVEGDEACGT